MTTLETVARDMSLPSQQLFRSASWPPSRRSMMGTGDVLLKYPWPAAPTACYSCPSTTSGCETILVTMAKCPVHVTSLLPPPRITTERRAAERDMLHRAAGIGNPTEQIEHTKQTEHTHFDIADCRADQEDGFWQPEESKDGEDEDYGALHGAPVPPPLPAGSK